MSSRSKVVTAKGGIMKALGPGFLFAAVSVGVSHVVQSTRAGAGYGFSLLWVIVLALLLKYPLFEFGQRYAAATGNSLLEGYRRQGKWSLVLYLILTVGTMFTVLAAVTAVTAGLAIQMTALTLPLAAWSAIIIAACVLILIIGRYPLLDKVIKVVMALLVVSTVAATIVVLPKLKGASLWGPVRLIDVAFIVGLVGWMPTGMDVSVWQSFWTLARKKETGCTPTLKASLFDFNLGYIATGALALMFCTLGTAVMFDKGMTFQSSSAAFAGQVIDLYTSTLGSWSRPIIAISAFTTIFSTVLTVVDGFPRGLQLVARRFRTPEDPVDVLERSGNSWDYWLWMGIMAVGAMLIIAFYLKSLKALVDLATTLSFITGPFLGFLTYRAITAKYVPAECRPAPWLRGLAVLGIVFLGGFLLFFIYYRLFMGN
ncbi:MAG: Nramp family divalent metal transporter [Candidatus Eisenbacteria bacterium]